MSADDAPVLRAVEEPPMPGTAATGEPGLESLHAILDRVASEHEVESITVVVDDADLGHQAFRAGPGPHAPLTVEPGVHISGDGHGVDALALHALTAASLRAAVLDGVVRGIASPELELRRLPGVCLVDLDNGDEPVIEVVVTAEAPGNTARAILSTARSAFGRPVAAVVERLGAQGGEPASASDPGAPRERSVEDVELLMVQTTPETREIEVHIAHGDARSIGRAPMAGGLAAAVDATLGALRELGMGLSVRVGWARTVETTVDPSFVVTVALHDADGGAASYGAAAGKSPIEAAAHATLLAARR